MFNFFLLISRQGKARVTKWYSPYTVKEKARTLKEVTNMVLERAPKLCNVIEWGTGKVVYRRYASLFFVTMIGKDDNELLALEIIHHFVEVLDRYFGNVCELDLIFNFHKASYILDEMMIAGELQESSKKSILRVCIAQDQIVEEEKRLRFG